MDLIDVSSEQSKSEKVQEGPSELCRGVSQDVATQKHFHGELLIRGRSRLKELPTRRIGGAFCPLDLPNESQKTGWT